MGPTRREVIASVPAPDAAAAAFAPLDSLLWSERAVLQRLLYQLTAQGLVIAAGRVEWLHDSDAEVRDLVRDLQVHELGRAIRTDEVAARYGVPPGAPLRQLIAAVPEPWESILTDHLRTLRELQDAAERTADSNAALLRAIRGRPVAMAGPMGSAS